jgi:hypothetical protein
MKYGDIEGQGSVYDSEGTLIPLKNECVMSTFSGFCQKVEQQVLLKWRIKFYDGPGLFVLTDKRLVFLRNPLIYNIPFKFSGSRFATLGDWEYWTNRSNKAVEQGAMEFFEIPYSEIEKVKTGRKFSRVFINSGDDKFRLTVESKVGAELEKLQDEDKKVQPIICFEELNRTEENEIDTNDLVDESSGKN